MDEFNEKVIEQEEIEQDELEEHVKQPTFMKKALKELIDFGIQFVVIFGIMWLAAHYVIRPVTVEGRSMYPTLEDRQMLFVWQLRYEPQLFDIIVLKYDETTYHVKRILGTPGDRVDYVNGVMTINGEIIDEPYILDQHSQRGFRLEDICGFDCEVIPDNYYLVLGDNRNNSGDSRNYGLIQRSQIIGRGVFRVWPLNQMSTLH